MFNETNRINGYVAKIMTLIKSTTPKTALKHFAGTTTSSQSFTIDLTKYHEGLETLKQI